MYNFYAIKSFFIDTIAIIVILSLWILKNGLKYSFVFIIVFIICSLFEYNVYKVKMSDNQLTIYSIFQEKRIVMFSELESIFNEGGKLKVGKIGITNYLVFTKKDGSVNTLNIAKFNKKLFIENLKPICLRYNVVYNENLAN